MPISNYPDQLWLRLFNADVGGFPIILTLAKAEAERGHSDSVGFGATVKVNYRTTSTKFSITYSFGKIILIRLYPQSPINFSHTLLGRPYIWGNEKESQNYGGRKSSTISPLKENLLIIEQ